MSARDWEIVPEVDPNGNVVKTYWGFTSMDLSEITMFARILEAMENANPRRITTGIKIADATINSMYGLEMGNGQNSVSIDFYEMGSERLIVVRDLSGTDWSANQASAMRGIFEERIHAARTSVPSQSSRTSAVKKTAAASSGGCLLPMMGIIGVATLPLVGLGAWLLS